MLGSGVTSPRRTLSRPEQLTGLTFLWWSVNTQLYFKRKQWLDFDPIQSSLCSNIITIWEKFLFLRFGQSVEMGQCGGIILCERRGSLEVGRLVEVGGREWWGGRGELSWVFHLFSEIFKITLQVSLKPIMPSETDVALKAIYIICGLDEMDRKSPGYVKSTFGTDKHKVTLKWIPHRP